MHRSIRHLMKLFDNKPNMRIGCRTISTVISPKLLDEQKIKNANLIEQIRSEFASYRGGTLRMSKDKTTGIATVCIDHPERKNAFSGLMMTQLTDIIAELEQWRDGKAVIIYGNNNFFCSGGDLNTVKLIDDSDGGRRMAILMHHNFARLQSLPLITLAVVQGMAIGGGAEMVTACDYRVMSKEAEIGFVHIRIGITAAWGGGARLARLVGPSKALDMMLTGRKIRRDEAIRIGLADDCIENNDSAIEEAHQWMRKYTKFSAETIRANKKIINSSNWLPLQLALQDEMEYFASVWGGVDHKKALDNNVKHR